MRSAVICCLLALLCAQTLPNREISGETALLAPFYKSATALKIDNQSPDILNVPGNTQPESAYNIRGIDLIPCFRMALHLALGSPSFLGNIQKNKADLIAKFESYSAEERTVDVEHLLKYLKGQAAYTEMSWLALFLVRGSAVYMMKADGTPDWAHIDDLDFDLALGPALTTLARMGLFNYGRFITALKLLGKSRNFEVRLNYTYSEEARLLVPEKANEISGVSLMRDNRELLTINFTPYPTQINDLSKGECAPLLANCYPYNAVSGRTLTRLRSSVPENRMIHAYLYYCVNLIAELSGPKAQTKDLKQFKRAAYAAFLIGDQEHYRRFTELYIKMLEGRRKFVTDFYMDNAFEKERKTPRAEIEKSFYETNTPFKQAAAEIKAYISTFGTPDEILGAQRAFDQNPESALGAAFLQPVINRIKSNIALFLMPSIQLGTFA